MPLQDAVPVIDDRRFDQLLTEVRTRIARYTPEWTPVWTDVNDNDPGITLAQLFAWMTELLTYRLSLVPELNYIKFLQLLGIELTAAQPATAQVTFPVSANFAGPSVIVPARTQLSAAPSDGGQPVIFETDKALIAVAAPLAAVASFDGYAPLVVTGANEGATEGFLPFGASASDGSALLLGFDAPGGFPPLELDLVVWTSSSQGTSGGKPAPAQCGLGSTRTYPPATLAWQYYDGQGWQPLRLLKDETLAFTVTGHVVLRMPEAGLLLPRSLVPGQANLCWLRALLQKSQYAQPPVLLAIRTNTVGVTQAETITDEALGGSNGARNQVFQLENTPVLRGSLHLEVDEGSGPVEWTQVDDFFAAGPNDEVYVLDLTTGQVRFGDGLHGAIPVAYAENPDGNIVAREYRTGGGAAGNLPAGAIKTMVGSVTGIDASGLSNLFASSGGRDEETLADAKARAPRAIKSRCRAVTADDYEYLATQVADVKRAKALPLFHPDFPGISVPGVVTVIVVPDGGPDNPMPMPSDGTLRTVCAYLDRRRLLAAELYVIPPTYQQVTVSGQVTAADSADLAELTDAVEQALLTYFHPIRGGDDGTGWPFGGTIYYSRVYQLIMNVSGVQSIQALTISVDGQAAPACTDVPIGPDALVYSISHDIQVDYAVGS
jgi:predicted phage baseplate assembly protein